MLLARSATSRSSGFIVASTRTAARHFSRTPAAAAAAMVKPGDSLPSAEVMENSPGNKINLAEVLKGKNGLIIGVPAAFSPGCTETHVPGYIADPRTQKVGEVFVVAVNDAFVMKAWGKSLDADGSSKIRWIADTHGAFTKALDLTFDATPLLGNERSRRYAMLVEDGKVKSVHVEPDNIGINESTVDKVLAHL